MDVLFLKYSARLFARPSFIEGIGRTMDIGTTLNEYNGNETPGEADIESIRSDWKAVGEQLMLAFETISK